MTRRDSMRTAFGILYNKKASFSPGPWQWQGCTDHGAELRSGPGLCRAVMYDPAECCVRSYGAWDLDNGFGGYLDGRRVTIPVCLAQEAEGHDE